MVNEKLIREFVQLLLQEKIRSSGFQLNKFKALSDLDSMTSYATSYLKFLGQGSTRTTFLLTSGKVLKLARLKTQAKGVAQNQVEVKTYQNLTTKSIVAEVYDYDEQFRWIVSELVRPLTSEADFLELIDIDPSSGLDFGTIMALADDSSLEGKKELSEKAQDFVAAVRMLYQKYKIIALDCERLEHWGKTADGRVALLDYGYDEATDKLHYEPERIEKEKKARAAAEKRKSQAQQKNNAGREG